MKHIVYLCVFILSLLPLERADAQRHVTVYDPEVSRPVQGFHVWADKLKADTTNVFGSAEVPRSSTRCSSSSLATWHCAFRQGSRQTPFP